jgi:hypothetical protein
MHLIVEFGSEASDSGTGEVRTDELKLPCPIKKPDRGCGINGVTR